MTTDPDRTLVSKEKRRGGITYYVHASPQRVVTGEHEDNPHGVNHEARCTAEDYLANRGEGQRCRSIVRGNFGDKAVQTIADALGSVHDDAPAG